MNTNRGPRQSRRLKLAGAVVGAGAVVALGSLAIDLERDGSGAVPLAGSGHGSKNTGGQPTVSAMNVGATATTTTPPAVPPIAVASPTLKAGH
jgi:hypothetical protein